MSLSAPFALPPLRSLPGLAPLITKDRYLADVQLVLLYGPFPSLHLSLFASRGYTSYQRLCEACPKSGH